MVVFHCLQEPVSGEPRERKSLHSLCACPTVRPCGVAFLQLVRAVVNRKEGLSAPIYVSDMSDKPVGVQTKDLSLRPEQTLWGVMYLISTKCWADLYSFRHECALRRKNC